jgi:hypothetical protein
MAGERTPEFTWQPWVINGASDLLAPTGVVFAAIG